MTTRTVQPRGRQLVDWSASVWAGIGSGLAFLLINIFIVQNNGWGLLNYTASLVLGQNAWKTTEFDVTVFIVGLVIHFILSILFAMIVAFIIHRWGLLVGFIGGALVGLSLYAINFYGLPGYINSLTSFTFIRGWPMAISHLVFGALAGGIYEALEVEEFETVLE